MSTLAKYLDTQQELLDECRKAMEETGELSDEQSFELAILDTAIAEKVDGWAEFLHGKKGTMAHFEEFIKERIKLLKEDLARLDKYKQRKINQLHTIIGLDNEVTGNDFKIKPTLSVTHTVDLSKVEPQYKTYVVKMNHTQFETFRLMNTDIEYSEVCGVSDLPKKHPALIERIEPSVRISPVTRKL